MEYESHKRAVACYAQGLADGRFCGMVRVTAEVGNETLQSIYPCEVTDATEDDATARALAWAHVRYPVD